MPVSLEIGRDDRSAGRQRLEQHDAERLPLHRGEARDRGPSQQTGLLRLGDRPEAEGEQPTEQDRRGCERQAAQPRRPAATQHEGDADAGQELEDDGVAEVAHGRRGHRPGQGANGEVAPCEILPSVGSIRETPLGEIISGPAWAEAVAGIRRKECHCTHDCNQQENILFSPRTYPRLLGL